MTSKTVILVHPYAGHELQCAFVRQVRRHQGLQAWPARANVDADRIIALGFLSGGATVLAAAGGRIDSGRHSAPNNVQIVVRFINRWKDAPANPSALWLKRLYAKANVQPLNASFQLIVTCSDYMNKCLLAGNAFATCNDRSWVRSDVMCYDRHYRIQSSSLFSAYWPRLFLFHARRRLRLIYNQRLRKSGMSPAVYLVSSTFSVLIQPFSQLCENKDRLL